MFYIDDNDIRRLFGKLTMISGRVVQPVVSPAVDLRTLPFTPHRPVFISSVRQVEQQLSTNGLFQNIFMLYKLFEGAGYLPFLLVDDNKKHPESKLYEKFRTIDASEWAAKPFRLHVYIEMGMSCGTQIRELFKRAGAKTFKLYLGNILNIDIETPTFHAGVNFCHHMVGEIETILVSPHYDFHQEYAAAINKVYPRVGIAPYVWDPMFIQDQLDIYRHRITPPYSFTIIEPNISFQKCSLIPLMIVESYYRANPTKVHEIAAINGTKLMESPHFKQTILPTLEIQKKGRLHLLGRADTREINKTLNTNIVIQHNVNNEYNYIFMEHLMMGFPVIHNFAVFKDYGYYYEGNDIAAGVALIDNVVQHHHERAEAYKAAARQLAWNFSIYNPVNIRAWVRIFEEGVAHQATPIQEGVAHQVAAGAAAGVA